MTDSPSLVRARSISPEELSEAYRCINELTRRLEEVKRRTAKALGTGLNEDAYSALEFIEPLVEDIPLPPDIEPEIREITAEDLEHSLRASDRSRMRRGEFQSGDVDKIRKFLRLSEEQMTEALGFDALVFERAVQEDEPFGLATTARHLLLLAIREPGAFRRALVRP